MRDPAAWSPVLIRAALGIVFLVSGLGKVLRVGPRSTGGVAGFAGFSTEVGVPAPEPFAWLVGLLELVGGLLLLIGLFTRYVAALLAIKYDCSDLARPEWSGSAFA